MLYRSSRTLWEKLGNGKLLGNFGVGREIFRNFVFLYIKTLYKLWENWPASWKINNFPALSIKKTNKQTKTKTLRGLLSVFVTLRHTKLTRNYYSLMLCMMQYHCYKAGIKFKWNTRQQYKDYFQWETCKNQVNQCCQVHNIFLLLSF